MSQRKQLTVFFILLAANALSAFVTYAFFVDQIALTAGIPMPDIGVSPIVLGLANAGIVLVLYGTAGLAGFWFARRLGLPGIYNQAGDWRRWVVIPMVLGLIVGSVLIVLDFLFAPINDFGYLVHPTFPLSIFASLSAGIGEEILFRGFVFGLWAFVFNWLLKRVSGRRLALWAANLLAALAFGAGHLGTVMYLTGAASLSDLSPVLLVEIFLINGIMGLVAGERYIRNGLVAAVGVHFWADIVWHVLWGLAGT